MRFYSLGGPFAHAVGLMLAVAGVSAAGAGDAPKRAAPVCAFLDPERAPRAALLEAKLLADPSATWVERAAIDKVLKEQALQAVFGPQGGADRVRLGKLLKADLLVLVRPVNEAKGATLEVVMSDTARGLRLMVRAVAATKDADADVAALKDAVRAGLKKFQEDVREVVAVPPFASTNLGYDYEYLKSAYAKLAEQAALANPGVVVVELAEAEAIAKEIKLADPGALVKRAPPLYLLGEFRHEGRGADVRIALKMGATRGGKPVGDPLAKNIVPADAPATLHKWVADRLAAEKAKPAAAFDAKTEARQLAELSRSRQRVADWDDALGLLEASLLLDPNQPDLNADAMAVLKVRMEQMLPRGKVDIDLLRRAAHLHRRGIAHMEALITSGAKLPRFDTPDGSRGGRMFFTPFPFPNRVFSYSPFTPKPPAPEVKELCEELQRERRETCLRLLPFIVKDGSPQEVLFTTHLAIWELPVPERYDEYGRLILKYQEFPRLVAATDGFVSLSPYLLTLEELPIYRKFLDRLDKDGNSGVRAAVARARKNLPDVEKQMAKRAAEAAELKRIAEGGKRPPPPPLEKDTLTREEKLAKQLAGGPLRAIRLKAASPEDEWFLDRLGGVVATGPGIDVFWSSGFFPAVKSKDPKARPQVGFGTGGAGPALLVMKEKGTLRRVWEKPGAPESFSAVCFDGQYVWLATEKSRLAPELFVFDPVNEKVYEVTGADGLPQPPEDLVKDPRRLTPFSLRLAVLEKGRVCVAGGFGRGWVGIATFDQAKKKADVKVIHEAREVANQADKDAWTNPKLAFMPVYMQILRREPAKDGKAGVRVLIGRQAPLIAGGTGTLGDLMGHPLVIDPDGSPAQAMKQALYPRPGRGLIGAPDGSARLVQSWPGSGELNLLRIDYPGTVSDLGQLAIPIPMGSVVADIIGDRLHIAAANRMTTLQPGGVRAVGSSWWTADLDGKNLRKLAGNLPPVRMMAPSSHYRMLVWLDLVPGTVVCELLDSAPGAPASRAP